MSEPAASPAILLVEDYPPSMYATGRVLRQAGFTVLEAVNGTQALTRAGEADLVLLDINLPDIDGFEVCRRLKADPETAGIPVLQLSAARRGTDDRAEGLEGGADAYLTQPVAPRELVATIGALLRMRRAEQEAGAARRRADALVDQLRVALAAAEDAQRQAVEADRAKGRFLATMSHEIRTPINAIMGYADLLDVGIHGALTPGQQGQLDRIKASSRHLLGLVNDILDLAKAEAGGVAVNPVPTPLDETVEAAVALVAPQAASKDIALEAEPCGMVAVGDEDRVRQILVNLLSNAVKFTAPGGRVTIACRRADTLPTRPGGEGPWIGVTVGDTGIGIAPEQVERVFEPFVQVDEAHTRQQGGTGLGLSISLRLARLMGGDIVVDSRVGHGSRFTLWLPAAAEVAPPAEAVPAAVRSPDGAEALGAALVHAADDVVARMGARLREDPRVPSARAADRLQLEDHQASLVASVGTALLTLSEAESDAGALQDGADIQRIIARRHGGQRRRLGWSLDEVRREYQILREEVEALLRREAPDAASGGTAMDVLRRYLERAERRTVRGFEEGSGPA
jgi:signal transduction histidine kinase